MTKSYLMNPGATKSLNPLDFDDSTGWTLLGGQSDTVGLDLLAQRVAWMYRGINVRGNTVSSMPWSMMQGDNEVGTDKTWGMKKPRGLEWFKNPKRIYKLLEQSLTVHNRAYLGLEVNASGYIKSIRYMNPTTIREVFDQNTGELLGYKRSINNHEVNCSRADQPPVKGQIQIFAIYSPDYLVEAGSSVSSPAMAAMAAAGVMYSYDEFCRRFFGNGAIKAQILFVEGAQQNEMERIQKWWYDVVTGIKNAFGSNVFRAKGINTQQVGEGMEALKDENMSTLRRQDIATALGVPESKLWSAAANMATRKEDEIAFYTDTIIPECDLIAEAFNETLLTANHGLDGFQLVFHPQSVKVLQEDETQRSSAMGNFVDSLLKFPTYDLAVETMNILGYDYEESFLTALKAYFDQKEAQANTPPPAPPQGDASQTSQDEPQTNPPENPPAPQWSNQDLSVSARAMLRAWQKKALHAFKLTGKAGIGWSTELLPAAQVADITERLDACGTAEQIKAVFDGVEIPEAVEMSDVDRLTAQLKYACTLLEREIA